MCRRAISAALSWLTFAALAIVSNQAFSGPVDLSAPSNNLGSASSRGYVDIWRELDEIDFGKELKVPVRVGFSSERQSSSPFFGKGWWCPVLEPKAYLKREKMLCATLLCGRVLYLRKDVSDDNTFHTLDNRWKGVITDRNIVVSREDGWRLTYEKGRLKELKTDAGRILNWTYAGDALSSIQESGGFITLKVDYDIQGTCKGLTVNDRYHGFRMDRRPNVQTVAGQKVVSGFDNVLSVWNFPDGKKETYRFEVTAELQPNLTLTDAQDVEVQYVWDSASGRIVSEGDWKYQIGQVNSEFELPTISRVDSKGVHEMVKSNNQTGMLEVESSEGGRIVSETYKVPGPLYNKPKKVTKIENGKEIILSSYIYDEKGKVRRQTGKDGFTRIYSYTDKGIVKAVKLLPPTDPEILKKLSDKETALKKAIEGAINEDDAERKKWALASFYIHETKTSEKALGMLKGIKDKDIVYAIKRQAITNSETLTMTEKLNGYKKLLEEYPEDKASLEFVINNAVKWIQAEAGKLK